MRILVAPSEDDEYAMLPLNDERAEVRRFTEDQLVEAMAELERAHRPRWVFGSVEQLYPVFLRAGLRLRRCHDLSLAEGLLLADEGRGGEPKVPAAAYARLHGLPVPEHLADHPEHEPQPALFEPRGSGLPAGVSQLDAAREVYADQRLRLNKVAQPDRFRLLVAAESASALAAAEMSHDGLPWRADVHSALLTELLGPKPPAGGRPRRLVELAAKVSAAFGGRQVNPDHSPSVVRAFAAEGIEVPSARAWVLREIDHPAVPPLREYKEMSRLYSTHGWSWLDDWVHDGRFSPVYVVGGVVSGRWASRGGAALQIPKALRVCVRADPGWRLVVADAAQLEPRVLAALSGDRRLADVSAASDLYTGLAETLGTERPKAKIAMLSAIYGGTSGDAAQLLPVLRQRFPDSMSYVERAALAGERGERVRSRLGRTSPAPPSSWWNLTGGATTSAAADSRALRAARDWGRFTRNFVVQATAADFTAVLLAMLRQRLPKPAHLVFFQHDEVIVHAPEELTTEVKRLLPEAMADTSAMLFGTACPVRFPLHVASVDSYADAK